MIFQSGRKHTLIKYLGEFFNSLCITFPAKNVVDLTLLFISLQLFIKSLAYVMNIKLFNINITEKLTLDEK
jgi:hypothetical protein